MVQQFIQIMYTFLCFTFLAFLFIVAFGLAFYMLFVQPKRHNNLSNNFRQLIHCHTFCIITCHHPNHEIYSNARGNWRGFGVHLGLLLVWLWRNTLHKLILAPYMSSCLHYCMSLSSVLDAYYCLRVTCIHVNFMRIICMHVICKCVTCIHVTCMSVICIRVICMHVICMHVSCTCWVLFACMLVARMLLHVWHIFILPIYCYLL